MMNSAIFFITIFNGNWVLFRIINVIGRKNFNVNVRRLLHRQSIATFRVRSTWGKKREKKKKKKKKKAYCVKGMILNPVSHHFLCFDEFKKFQYCSSICLYCFLYHEEGSSRLCMRSSFPKSYNQAVNEQNPYREKWLGAVDEELRSLQAKKVFTIVPLEKGMKLLPNHFVFAYKTQTVDSNQKVIRFKARLVVSGNYQRESIDYDETFISLWEFNH